MERVLEILLDGLSSWVDDLVTLIDDVIVSIRCLRRTILSFTLGPAV